MGNEKETGQEKKRIPPTRAAILASLATGLAFGMLSLPARIWHPLKIPVAARMVERGAPVNAADVRWVPAQKMAVWNRRGPRWAKQTLYPGEVLSPMVLTSAQVARNGERVQVVPASPADLLVATAGGWVEIVVTSPKGVVWTSGAVRVLSVPAAGSGLLGGSNAGGSGVGVLMTPKQAVAFEGVRMQGAVSLVGVSP